MDSHRQTQVFVECQASGCASVLQVVVPSTHRQGKGEVLVRCGKCHRLLRVQLPPEMLEPTTQLPGPAPHVTQPPLAPASRPGQLQYPPQVYSQGQQQGMSAGPSVSGQGVRRRRPPSAYHDWISQEMKRLKASHPGLDHQAAFKIAASSWVTSGAKAAADHAKQQQQQAVDQSHGLFTPQQQQQYLAVPTHQVPSSIIANHGAMQQYQDNSNSSSHGGSTFHAQAQLQQLQGGGGEVMQFSSSMVQPLLGAGGASVAPLLMPLAQPQMAGATADQQGPELQLLPAPLQHVGNGDVGYGSGGDGAGGGEGLSEGFAQQAGSSAPQGSANPVVVVADGSQWQDAGFARAVQAAEGGAAAAEVWDVMGGGGAYGIGSAAADTPAAESPSIPAGSTTLQPHMPPPAAHDTNNGTEASVPSPHSTPAVPAAPAAAATPQPQHTAGTKKAPATPPAAATASTDGAQPAVASSSQLQLNPVPLTLQETWETLCQQPAPHTLLKLPHDEANEQLTKIAEVSAAAAVQAGDSCPLELTTPSTKLLHAQTADGTHPQQQQQLLRDMQPAVHLTTPALMPQQQPTGQQNTPCSPGTVPSSGPAAASGSTPALVSEGSSLASWQSSGGLGPQPGGELSGGLTASPDPGSSQSGAAGSSVPAASILRHNSAPITTSLGGVVCLPHSRGKTAGRAGYSITTAGPAKPARG